MRTVKYAEDKKRKTEGKESLIKFKAKHSKKDPGMNSKRNADYDNCKSRCYPSPIVILTCPKFSERLIKVSLGWRKF